VVDIFNGYRLAERQTAGWRLRIEHTTSVWYPCPVLASSNEARMTPPTLPTQVTLESRVTVGPDVPVWTYTDYWGTIVSVFDLPEPHDALVIRAAAMVETSPAGGLPGPEDRPTWTALREMAANSRLIEFLMPTPLTTVTEQIAAAAAAEIAGLPPDAAAEAISARVRERVAYQPGATDADSGAQLVWDEGRGVCQDMAQLTVALLRAVGLPARYVSGYLHPWERAEPGSTAVGRSHAWAEYWAGSWTPLDPTTGTAVGERHVVVARGRDYDDVQPLKGAYRGPSAVGTRVTVEVTRLA
jgi:transglutaminase-like putative cysteine protease